VTVLDLGTITAGAAVGRLLADYGATVIKVENPQQPDPFRRWASASGVVTGESPLFEANNAGKLGVALDLKHPEGREALLRLAVTADVLIENYRVGVTERLGISFSDLAEVNPRLVYLSLASQGQDGPQARYSSYGSTLDLTSGLGSVTGYPDGPPVWSSYLVNYPDQLASLAGAALVVQCLADGVAGTHIDLSQRELVSWTLADLLADQLVTGRTARRTGNRRPHAVPVLDARDRAAEAHFGRRRVFIDGPTGRRTRGFPFVLRNYVPPVPARAPAVGEHNKRFAAQPHPR
jgi:crotonobetainyl-CoA:carnitine CoA-transferase CaiB-like acyl-CoA transferase